MTAFWIAPDGSAVMSGDKDAVIPPEGWTEITEAEFSWASGAYYAQRLVEEEKLAAMAAGDGQPAPPREQRPEHVSGANPSRH